MKFLCGLVAVVTCTICFGFSNAQEILTKGTS